MTRLVPGGRLFLKSAKFFCWGCEKAVGGRGAVKKALFWQAAQIAQISSPWSNFSADGPDGQVRCYFFRREGHHRFSHLLGDQAGPFDKLSMALVSAAFNSDKFL